MRSNERSNFENSKLLEVLFETWNLYVTTLDKVIEGKVRMFERRSRIYGRRNLRVAKVVRRMTLCILQTSLMIVLRKCNRIKSWLDWIKSLSIKFRSIFNKKSPFFKMLRLRRCRWLIDNSLLRLLQHLK